MPGPRQPRYSWDALWAFASGRGLSMSALAERIGASDGRQLYRWRRDGGVPEAAADRVAVALGVMPGDIWPEWDADGLAMAEAAEAERRARHAAAKRRKYRKDAAARAARLAANRAYKAENREAQRVKYAAYRAANRERLRLARRRRYEANREAERERQRAYDRRMARARKAQMAPGERADNVA